MGGPARALSARPLATKKQTPDYKNQSGAQNTAHAGRALASNLTGKVNTTDGNFALGINAGINLTTGASNARE